MMTLTGEAVSTRFHPRVDAQLRVKLKLNGRAVVALSTDLSMAGLCLQGDFPEIANQVTLAIPLPDGKHLITEAKVKWREAGKVALEFEQLDWEEMFALARLIHPRLP